MTLRKVTSAGSCERQCQIGSRTGARVAQFAAYRVGSPFSHQPIGHQFATGDGDKSVQTIAFSMVEQHDATLTLRPLGSSSLATSGRTPE